jgi:hypothetical protein
MNLGHTTNGAGLSTESQAKGAQDRRLSRAIGADDHVHVRPRNELQILVGAEINAELD